MKEKSILVAKTIAEWCQNNAFELDLHKDGKNYLKFRTDQTSSALTKECQKYITNYFESDFKIKTEEKVQTPIGDPGLRFDFFLPDERTAIELCLSVLENEIEKDILKAILDQRVICLIIVATNKSYGNTDYCAVKTWNQPAKLSLLKALKGQKVEPILVWFDNRTVEVILLE